MKIKELSDICISRDYNLFEAQRCNTLCKRH